ncbi:MAG: thioredoxin family protein [Bacteroidetes bacterium]|nr:thioredoxin family protein [Bacteroidota bacterium]
MAASPGESQLPSLSGATAWLNTQPLAAADLRGKVVLFEFWTYTCINWRRTLPYVNAWAEKYKQQGLVVIGVHTPEFSFEKEIDNVRWAIKDMKIGFPVAMDNNYAVWRAFDNNYWPALYFVDAKGRIRYHHFGEGSYDESEKVIQQLLTESGVKSVSGDLAPVEATGSEAAADWNNLQSPENFLGYDRTQNFVSPGAKADKPRLYSYPSRLQLNDWALSGNWTLGKEGNVSNESNGKLRYRFHARDVNLIMGLAKPGTGIRFRVLIDGMPPGDAHGVDIDSEGNGTVTEQRMYQLIRQSYPIQDHDFEIEFMAPGAEVFDFTFG